MKHVMHIAFILFFFVSAQATHNRAGEITYRHISGNTYEITIVTYTYTPSAANEYRGQLLIDWGDGTKTYIQRVREDFLPDNYSKNTYVGLHTYPGPGVYKIVMEDPNRNLGVKNIFDSVNIPFSISTVLKIDPVLGGNNTPILLNPPVDKAALGQRFVHNPAAFDIDGDSLSYSLAFCRGKDGEIIPGYSFPAASKEFRVDSINGDLVWDAPMAIGIYNVAMHIEEWRDGVKIGYVARDIQIEVYETDNTVPEFMPISDICIRAGDTVRVQITAIDADNDPILVSARGGPLEATETKATFTSKTGVGSVTSEFTWVPTATEVRSQPYTVIFKASDIGKDVPLSALQYLNIQVIGHTVSSISTEQQDVQVALSWHDADSNHVHGYTIYRSNQSIPYTPDYCEFDLPPALQPYYTNIAQISAGTFSFNDTNSGWGLTPGNTYCYRILSLYNENFPGYISEETCIYIEPVSSVITQVSVQKTDCGDGEIFLRWTQPFSIDTSLFKEPYKYHIMRLEGHESLVFTEIDIIHSLEDTIYIDTKLCTEFSPYTYRIDLYSYADATNPVLIGQSPLAASPFLHIFSSDNTLRLELESKVSWNIDSIIVYRKHETENSFDSLGIFSLNSFIDTTVINLQEYCYYVITSGYFDAAISPLRTYNYSQIICSQPIDTIPPTPLSFELVQDCKKFTHTISWKITETDVQKVRIYHKYCSQEEYSIVSEVLPYPTYFIHEFSDTDPTMSSCYYITALDNSGNESSFLLDSCVYTCPLYVLPNIFTPNNDGENEIYRPAEYRYVERVDMKIYNSWGELVFHTTNPEINWDGTHFKTNKELADGVFYYVCDVYEYWADCTLQARVLAGFIHKFSEQ